MEILAEIHAGTRTNCVTIELKEVAHVFHLLHTGGGFGKRR